MSIEHRNPDELFKLPGFSQAVQTSAGKRLYIAGQGAFDKNMNLIGANDYEAQARQAFNNIAIALADAGASPEQLVSSVM